VLENVEGSRNTLTVLLVPECAVIAASGNPFASKSAVAIPCARRELKAQSAMRKGLIPAPHKSQGRDALIRHRKCRRPPSFVKSAITTPEGFAPEVVVNGEPPATANVASPLFRKTLIVLSLSSPRLGPAHRPNLDRQRRSQSGAVPVPNGEPVAMVNVPSKVLSPLPQESPRYSSIRSQLRGRNRWCLDCEKFPFTIATGSCTEFAVRRATLEMA